MFCRISRENLYLCITNSKNRLRSGHDAQACLAALPLVCAIFAHITTYLHMFFLIAFMINNIFLLFNLGTTEIIIIVFVILLLFGGKKIPELMRGLGKGVRSFKEGMEDIKNEIDRPVSDETKKSDSSAANTNKE